MTKSIDTSMTYEEAVARMINLAYIPTGFTVLDMTAAYKEVAEVAYENRRHDKVTDDQATALRIRMDACQARHSLAHCILEDLKTAIANSEDSLVIASDDPFAPPRLRLDSVSIWALEHYGISLPESLDAAQDTDDADAPSKSCRWEDVTIKIYAHHNIGYSVENGRYKKSTFQKLNLMGKRKNAPNEPGILLIGLSMGKKFPAGNTAKSKDKTALSKLRRALEQLTRLNKDPFYRFNSGDGWKPRFQLIDDRRNADERAKKRATSENFDDEKQYQQYDSDSDANGEAKDFEEEGDEAQDFLDKNS